MMMLTYWSYPIGGRNRAETKGLAGLIETGHEGVEALCESCIVHAVGMMFAGCARGTVRISGVIRHLLSTCWLHGSV